MTNKINDKKKVPKWIRIMFFLSFPGTILFIYRMIYEMTYITWLYGPQTVGFSLAHSHLSLLIFYIISFISFIWWILFFLIWHLANFKAISKKSIVQNEGRTALMSASVGNKIEIVDWLLKNGSEINIKDSENTSALDEAVNVGNINIARLLIKNGADLNSLQRTLQDDSLILYGNYRSEEQISIDFYIKRDSLIHILLKESKDK